MECGQPPHLSLRASGHRAEHPNLAFRERAVYLLPVYPGALRHRDLYWVPPELERGEESPYQWCFVYPVPLPATREQLGAFDQEPQEAVCEPVPRFRLREIPEKL